MEETDSENEGQLLIDESVDASKRGRGGRKRGPALKKPPQKKKSLKIVVKAPPTPRGRKPKTKSDIGTDDEPKVATAVRASTRARKRVRKHSPSPVQKKKEPPKKKLKVKIKNIVKTGKRKKITAIPDAEPNNKITKKDDAKPAHDLDNVDIESISDDELQGIQYSSVIVNEDPAEKAKVHSKPKKKGGIKLKLSLGKVLTPKIAESLDDIVTTDDTSSKDEISALSSSEEEKHVKPLIISKRRVSGEMSPNSKAQVSIIPTGNESPYYSSSSEDHKPLTLRLSVGRPKIPKRSISEFERPVESQQKPFHNIQRSWSVTPVKTSPGATNITLESTATEEPQPNELPKGGISATPYFSAGLQSLLDVVSVELNEQNKASTESELRVINEHTKQSSPPKSHPPVSNLPTPAFQKSISVPHGHEGHLPSMSFPKPEFHFSSKKRPRVKSVTNISPQAPPKSNNPEIEKEVHSTDEQHLVEEYEEPPDHILTEKERRRRDKKKSLNDDFVDPDSIVQGGDIDEKKTVKKKPLPSYTPKSKAGGFSLLMPQMKSKPVVSEPKAVGLNNSAPCSLPNKSLLSKRPKKGMATTKQRLANKLKIGRTFAY